MLCQHAPPVGQVHPKNEDDVNWWLESLEEDPQWDNVLLDREEEQFRRRARH
jgi:hypothetical protein